MNKLHLKLVLFVYTESFTSISSQLTILLYPKRLKFFQLEIIFILLRDEVVISNFVRLPNKES